MARIRAAFLCNAASQETSGLVSVLGAFVDLVADAALPIRHMLWLVGRVEYEPAELNRELSLQIVLVRLEDGAELVSIDGQARVELHPGADPAGPIVSNLLFPIPMEFDRPGEHELRLLVEGELLWTAALNALLLDAPPQS